MADANGAKATVKTGKKSGSETSSALKDRVGEVRTTVLTRFAEVVLAMSTVPRYANLSVCDLQAHALTPLIKERVALAQSIPGEGELERTEGIAIWATVSDEVDAKIREQIKAGVFPIRMMVDDWNSGETIWLFDMIAPPIPTVGQFSGIVVTIGIDAPVAGGSIFIQLSRILWMMQCSKR